MSAIEPVPIKPPLPPVHGGWHRVPNVLMEALAPGPDWCPAYVSYRGLFVTMTACVELDGKRWLHVALSRPDKMPSYRDMCDAKRHFIGKDKFAVQIFAPEAEHVNIHSFCLHLWSCLDGHPLPDFTHGSGSI